MKLFFSILSFLFSISVSAQDFNSEDYIRKFHKMAIAEMHSYSIPASITLAQGILESGNGNSELALKSKNHFELNAIRVGLEKKRTMTMMKNRSVFVAIKKCRILIEIILSF